MLSHKVNEGKGNFHTLLKQVKIGIARQFLMYNSETEKVQKTKFFGTHLTAKPDLNFMWLFIIFIPLSVTIHKILLYLIM